MTIQIRRNRHGITAVLIKAEEKITAVSILMDQAHGDVEQFLRYGKIHITEDGPGWWIVRRGK